MSGAGRRIPALAILLCATALPGCTSSGHKADPTLCNLPNLAVLTTAGDGHPTLDITTGILIEFTNPVQTSATHSGRCRADVRYTVTSAPLSSLTMSLHVGSSVVAAPALPDRPTKQLSLSTFQWEASVSFELPAKATSQDFRADVTSYQYPGSTAVRPTGDSSRLYLELTHIPS